MKMNVTSSTAGLEKNKNNNKSSPICAKISSKDGEPWILLGTKMKYCTNRTLTCLDIGTEKDSIHQLDRAAQVTIFRLRTGHCQLLSHLHRLKISHSDECPCSTGPQPPPTTSCSPAPPSTLWDARHGPVRWMPTGSLRDRLRHCGSPRTSPYCFSSD